MYSFKFHSKALSKAYSDPCQTSEGGESRDSEKEGHYLGHHGWAKKEISDFRWSKSTKVAPESIRFSEIFLSVFSNFLHFYIQ